MWQKKDGIRGVSTLSLAVALTLSTVAWGAGATTPFEEQEAKAGPWTQIEDGVWTRQHPGGEIETRTEGLNGTSYQLEKEQRFLGELLTAAAAGQLFDAPRVLAEQKRLISVLEGMMRTGRSSAVRSDSPPGYGGCFYYLNASATMGCASQQASATATYQGECSGSCTVFTRTFNRRKPCEGSEANHSAQCFRGGDPAFCSSSGGFSFPARSCFNTASSVIACPEEGFTIDMFDSNGSCNCIIFPCGIIQVPDPDREPL